MKPGYIAILLAYDSFEQVQPLLSSGARVSHYTLRNGRKVLFADEKMPIARTWHWPKDADCAMILEPDKTVEARILSLVEPAS